MKKIVILYYSLVLSIMSISSNTQAFTQPMDAEHVKNIMHNSEEGLPQKIEIANRLWSYQWIGNPLFDTFFGPNFSQYAWNARYISQNEIVIYIPNHCGKIFYDLFRLQAESSSYIAPPSSPRY